MKLSPILPFELYVCFDLAIESKQHGKIIGLISLACKQSGQAAIGYALGSNYRGQGFATEAARALIAYGFETLGLQRIEAETDSWNQDSWNVMERLGMHKMSQPHPAEVLKGKHSDIVKYEILEAEYVAQGLPWSSHMAEMTELS